MPIKSNEKALTKSGIETVRNQFHSDTGLGILSPARYDIIIASNLSYTQMGGENAASGSKNSKVMRRLSNSCESASFPGRAVSTQPNRILGPVREMPYDSLYSGDLDLTFRLGTDMFERKYFEFWMDTIVDHSTHSLGYYDDYTRDIYIAQLGPDDSVVYKIRLTECYPKAINAIDVGFDKVDEYERQSVSIAFREYDVLTSHLVVDDAVTSIGERTGESVRKRNNSFNQEAAERRAAANRELIGSIINDANRRAEEARQQTNNVGFRFTPR